MSKHCDHNCDWIGCLGITREELIADLVERFDQELLELLPMSDDELSALSIDFADYDTPVYHIRKDK